MSRIEKNIIIGQDQYSSGVVSLGSGKLCAFSEKTQKHPVNEDGIGWISFSDRAGVLILADGAGGYASGEKASEIAIQAILRELERGISHDGARNLILDGIEKANETIKSLGVGAATTLSIVEVDGQICRTYHVGDSPIFVIGQRGKLKFETTLHSPAGYAIESGLIQDDQIPDSQRHFVSNLVGLQEMKIEIGPVVELSQRDTVFIGSDGVSDNLSQELIVETVRRGSLEEARDRLAEAARDQMKKYDDVSFLLFRLS